MNLQDLTEKNAHASELLQKLFFSIDLEAFFEFMKKREPNNYRIAYRYISESIHFPKHTSLGKALKLAYHLCRDEELDEELYRMIDCEASQEDLIETGKYIIKKILIRPFSHYLCRKMPDISETELLEKIKGRVPEDPTERKAI